MQIDDSVLDKVQLGKSGFMPTPLVHLYVSQQILAADAVPGMGRLRRHAGDFLLGSIAPDAWTLGGLDRTGAHLLPIPVPPDKQGATELLNRYPELRQASRLQAPQAAFVAGYMTHLLIDEIWYHQIFDPFFLNSPSDQSARRRLILHNALRLHLEDRLEDHIQPDLIRALATTRVVYTIPPFPDSILTTWRDLISAELRSGGEKRSAEVFAERMGVPVHELLAILHSSETMQREILSRLPDRLVEHVLEAGITQGRNVIFAYLRGEELAKPDD